MNAFAREHGLVAQRLHWWRRRIDGETRPQPKAPKKRRRNTCGHRDRASRYDKPEQPTCHAEVVVVNAIDVVDVLHARTASLRRSARRCDRAGACRYHGGRTAMDVQSSASVCSA
jgi:hypothetical protein